MSNYFGICEEAHAKMHWDFDAREDVQDLKRQLDEGLLSTRDFSIAILGLWIQVYKNL